MKKHKILLIDDEKVNVRVLALSLKSDGYDVITAYNGKEGLESFIKNSPAIIITDIKMPGMEGIELLKNIKQHNAEAEVIIITGHGDIDLAIKALKYGASDFINKPIRDEVLAVALKRAEDKLDIREKLQEYTNNLENMIKIATQDVRRKSNFQAKLIKSSSEGIVATDDKWRVVIFNPGAEKIFGYSKSKIIGKTELKDLLPANIRQFFELEKKIIRQQIIIINNNGEHVPVRFSGTILQEADKMMGCVAFFQDLREIKQLEKELIHSERLAAVGQTMAGMAHCIKNILHGFKGGSYLVNIGLDKNNPDKLKNGWQMVQRNIGRISDLVLDLLSYSKDRSPEPQICFPNKIAADACELLQNLAEEHEIAILQDYDLLIGEGLIDPRMLQRILLNLISNAIDACIFDETIGKSWQVSVKTALIDQQMIILEVQDNGCGMSDEVKSKLFSSFFSTKGSRGTGLGLLVTRKLIKENKGSIEVSSMVDKGTVFKVKLPFKAGNQL